jgi:hypothetical protein
MLYLLKKHLLRNISLFSKASSMVAKEVGTVELPQVAQLLDARVQLAAPDAKL